MHVFVFYFLLIAFSILVCMLFSYSAFRLQECSIKSVSQSSRGRPDLWFQSLGKGVTQDLSTRLWSVVTLVVTEYIRLTFSHVYRTVV